MRSLESRGPWFAFVAAVAAAVSICAIGAASAQTVARKTLTLDGARAVLAAAEHEAKRLGAGGAISVVDDGGNLLVSARLDGTFPAASPISVEKARSAAVFRRPTSVFEKAIKDGRLSLLANDQLLPLQGGVPVMVDGEVVGGVGVAGAASAQQDEDIAVVAAGALGATAANGVATPDVAYLPAASVEAAFRAGKPLLEVANYKIHASRRDAPGMAEVHVRDTDTIHVIDGEADLVVGGDVVDGKTTAPGEIRGASIRGGRTLHLRKGDVAVVPNGTPHWFREVKGPFLYYVVKVEAEG
jgi:glc operon protein GlcG